MMNTDNGAPKLPKKLQPRRAAHAAEKTADAGAPPMLTKFSYFRNFVIEFT